jgi:hypothetical protein
MFSHATAGIHREFTGALDWLGGLQWVMRRTAVVNQVRSLLLERGLTPPKGRGYVDRQLSRILEDGE